MAEACDHMHRPIMWRTTAWETVWEYELWDLYRHGYKPMFDWSLTSFLQTTLTYETNWGVCDNWYTMRQAMELQRVCLISAYWEWWACHLCPELADQLMGDGGG